MLSKEEIKEMKDYFNECITKDTVYEEDLTINYMKIATEYIDQLESDKQKLIEKLEEDVKSNNKSMTDVLNYTNMVKATRVLYAQEILNFISE